MDLNVLRGILSVLFLLIFLGIVAWAWSKEQIPRFEQAAQLPFDENDQERRHG